MHATPLVCRSFVHSVRSVLLYELPYFFSRQGTCETMRVLHRSTSAVPSDKKKGKKRPFEGPGKRASLAMPLGPHAIFQQEACPLDCRQCTWAAHAKVCADDLYLTSAPLDYVSRCH